MFTLDQIKEVHNKVKSGADFPRYVQDLIKLGVVHYDTFVYDGHTHFVGKEGYNLSTTSKYPEMDLADRPSPEQFRDYLKSHQDGQSDYLRFCQQAAATGVEKWSVDTKSMTCTYFDRSGNKMLTEQIPSAPIPLVK